MFLPDVSFPVYRKYQNNKSYFKVLSKDEFEEIQFIGKKCFKHQFKAKILPDRYFIKDMIELIEGRWQEITEAEYISVMKKCSEALQE